MASKNWKPDTGAFMQDFAQAVEGLSEWNTAALIAAKDAFLAEKQAGAGKLMAPLRLALTGMPGGPDTFEIAALIGKAESLAAIKTLG
ncbi:MAG: hypothetical protein EAZ89_15055 [Bacteroidetes bacterium]|nr:MAG: hypothetical protein EAZ89_15055 [Bacteroidota bacterium]